VKYLVVLLIPLGMSLRFRPEAAGGLDAVLELRVSGTSARFAVSVADRRLRVERRAAPEAGAGVSISAGDIVRLVTGVVRWPALLAGKRLELSGDPFLALRFPKLFGFGG
jgi:alkyl sulfatase BDS1-like metallo-beta-lactamase superfamily hydrolase